MPHMDGYTSSKKIRSLIKDYEEESNQIVQGEDLKIIAITGHVE